MKIIKQAEVKNFKRIIDILNNGGLIVFPTETCYGVGVDATNKDAVTKLLKYKDRPEGKAISIAVASKEMAKEYVDTNSSADQLYLTFMPGPITIISKSKHKVDNRLESESGNIGIRIPNYKFMLDLLQEFGKPITSTSANLSGKKTPYSVNDLLDNLPAKHQEMIDLFIDAGELPKNPPSTVVDTTTTELMTYRQGRIDPAKVKDFDSLKTESVEETILAGEKFFYDHKADLSKDSMVILLNGELGAGKTHFTKGIAKALGIDRVIKSPTYNYVNEYKFGQNGQNGKLYHFDAWRIQNIEDLNMLQFKEWFKPNNVIVMEWPSVAMNLDQDFFEKLSYYYIDFLQLSDNEREIRIYLLKD